MQVPDFTDKKKLEKYSSAFTLSDMELFIFPDLLFALVLANIMSPRLWAWKDDPWFAGIEKLAPYRRILRVKQYIMDHYDFNLDLDTWGLTTKEEEINRFKDYIDLNILKQSNALFGYEGDKYYFSVDIRKHFGLDKYTTETIPYWKTETLEAMDAFAHKEGYTTGAGECVSLSTLYLAALFVIAQIPLEDMFLIGTPLHSQGFILINDGVITNNRRIVTKQMWFNGTELSRKARRAIENEKIIIVGHISGQIHYVYDEATIDPIAYEKFSHALTAYLQIPLTPEIFANFLRDHSKSQKCFQIRFSFHGKDHYIESEKVYSYEHGNPFKASDNTRVKLLALIEEDEFYIEPIADRIVLNDMEEYIITNQKNINDPKVQEELQEKFLCDRGDKNAAFQALLNFVTIKPRLPEAKKTYSELGKIHITPAMTREQVFATVAEQRTTNPTADLAFYAFRDMESIDWTPFCTSALERSPTCIEGLKDKPIDEAYEVLVQLPNESLYDGNRFAQPDEVWNFQRGDGWEKAFLLATVIKNRDPKATLVLSGKGQQVIIEQGGKKYTFRTGKKIEKRIEV